MDDTNTSYAQGGIAAVTYSPDSFEKHIADTIVAGDGHCDVAVVEKVIREAPQQIEELLGWGIDFDRDGDGKFDLHREGGHSENRILHHKDNTGYEVQQALIRKLRTVPNIEVFENTFAIEILTQHHLGEVVTMHTPNIECYGAYVLDQRTNHIHTFLSKVTLLATGGIGGVYATTTNPDVATGTV